MKIRNIFITAVTSLALAGCALTNPDGSRYGDKQLGGSLLGAAAGGLLGAQIGGGSGKLAATAAGALLGLYLGNSIGQSLDRADRLAINQSTQNALESTPTGQSTVWQNPNHRAQSVVVPTRTYQANGRYCREYQQDITVDGKTQRAYGKACRRPDGSWQIQNGQQSAAPVYRQTPAPVYSPPVYQSPVYQSPVYSPPIYRSGRGVIFSTRRHCPRVWVRKHFRRGAWIGGHYRRVCR